MPIRQLPDTLINQIAAGEVVERPASVVKELVENALDAGANRVDIDLEEGGAKLIRIRDDGVGIDPAEMPLALSRHATSKIASLDDLEAVATLGFRGEALPSIASVSRFRLVSRRRDEEHGACLQVNGGKAEAVVPHPHPPGTTVEVRDLFHNVPARRKFLRAERTELNHIEEWLRSLALARPDIDLRISHNGKPVRRYRPDPTHPEQRVLEALGEEFFTHALRVAHEASGLRLHGWIALPDYTRSTGQQYLYVNGRCVRDRNMAHAIKQGYQDVLFHGRYPACVLFLEVDPRRVDVNVHPAKHEVRFRDARLIHDFIQRTLHEALGDVRAEAEQAWRGMDNPGAASMAGMSAPATGAGWQPPSTQRIAEARAGYQALYAGSSTALPPSQAADGIPALGYAIAQLHGRYILAENAAGLIVVDTRQARGQLLLERLQQAAASADGIRSVPLLVPATVPLDAKQQAALERHASALRHWGLEWAPAAHGQLQVRGLPGMLGDLPVDAFMTALLSRLPAADAAALPAQLASAVAELPQARLTLVEMNAMLRHIEARQAQHPGEGYASASFSLAQINDWFIRG